MAQAGHQNAHALDWVKGELDETLKQAVQSLEFFVENTGDEYELASCAEALHQVMGTLRLVELDGAVRYAGAMAMLLEAVREDRIERSEAIFEALMRGLLQLPAYLEYIQSGGADLPEALLPEINELRELGGQAPLDAEQFFDVALDAVPPEPAQPPAAPLAALAAKARPTYQKALVAWLRNPTDPNALRVLSRIAELVRQAAPGPEIARLWWAAAGFFEGLGAGTGGADSGAKQLLTALDRELKKHAEGSATDAADAALTRRLLYRVAQATDAGPLSRELDAAFGLAGRVPSQALVEEVGRRLHGPDTSVLRSVAEAVKEDFNRARDIIEIFGASSDANPADLAPLHGNLGRMADTLGMMGLNDLADAVRTQREVVKAMAEGSLAADEPRVVDVAEVLLHVDAFLVELADEAQRTLRVTDVVAPVPTIGLNTSGVAQPRLTDLESRQVARALYSVGLQELEMVREAVVADAESDAALVDQPPRLIALAGGMHMLGHEQAAVQLGQLAGVVEEASHEPFAGARLEALAEAITALESTLEAYRSEQTAARTLELADERLGELLGGSGTADAAPLEELAGGDTAVDFEFGSDDLADEEEAPLDVGMAADEDLSGTVEIDEITAEAPGIEEALEITEAELTEVAAPEVEAEAEVGVAEPEPEPEPEVGEALPYPVLSEEYDAETLDIFLEEADEVVGLLGEQVPQWIANPSDGEVLGEIRRAFHTLKGSGRLVGALLMGEFAWGYENLLNRVIEGTCEASPELIGTLERVVAVLPGLVDQLRGGPSPGGEVAALMAAAEALAEGRPLPAAAAAVPLTETGVETPVAEAPGIEEALEITEAELTEVAAPEVEAEAEVGVAEPEPEPEPEVGEALPYPVLSEEYDAETLDIFLEEADEVVGLLGEQVPQWIANPSDGEVLGEIRRAFHTLKGSGRLVGALLMGEFAWGYENLLNRVIEGTCEASPELIGTLERVVAVLPGLVDQLRGGPSPGGEVAALMAAAEALAEGRPLPAAAAAVPLTETGVETPVAEAPGVEEALEITEAESVEVAEVTEETPGEEPGSIDDETAPVEILTPDEEAGTLGVDETPTSEIEAVADEPTAEVRAEPVPRIDASLYAIYQLEAESHLETLAQFVTGVRTGASAVPTEGVVRALHTLRGSSSMAEAQPIAALAGLLEEECKPRLASTEALAARSVEQLAEAADLMRQMVAALGDRELPFPESDALLDRIRAAESAVEVAQESSTHDLLMHGADLIDLLDDGVSRWVAASADSEPLRQLADEAAEVARQAEAADQLAVAEVCGLLETFAGLLADGRFGPEGEILALLGDTASGLTEMFDSLAVSRPADPDPVLVIGLRSRIDQAGRADEAPETETPAPVEAPAADQAGAEALAPDAGDLWSPEAPLDPDLLEIFMEEGSELLDEAEATVHRWQESVDDREAIALLQRQLHTLKGGARMAGIEPMGDLSHASESLLTGVVEGRLEPSETLFEVLNESVDRLVGMLEAVREGQPVALAPTLLEDLRDLAGGEAITRSAAAPAPVPEAPRAEAPEPAAETAAVADAPWSPEAPLDPDLLEIFMEEGSELLDEAEATVHRWQESVDDREAIALLQRQLHTLKGGARMAGIEPMGDLSHASESLLTGVVEGRLHPSERLFTELNAAVDRLAQMLDAVRHERPLAHASALRENLLALAEGREPATTARPVLAPLPEVELPPAAPPPKQWDEAKPAESAEEAVKQAAPQPAAARRAPATQQEQVRVPAQLLNSLVNLAGEVSIYRSRLEQQNNVMRFNLGEFEQTVERLREQLRQLEIETDAQIMSHLEAEGRTIEDFDPLEMDQYTALQTTSRALLESLNDLTNVREYLDDLRRESDTLLLQQSRVNTELQQGLMQARMMPFSRLVPRMRRIVRQTAQEMGKKVELWVQGEQSDVDSAVVDRIIAPLEHLIRNAIAHGIESPEAREQAGKDRVGKLTLTVDRDGSDVVFRVKDDGAGIDVGRVRQKAVERGLIAADAEISEHDILQLIFESGMSTAKEVTQISGRGVGMDVVISEVRQLGGTVEINSKRGFGASFYLRIPFTLAVNRALLVNVGEELFAIPLTSIEGIVRMRADELEAFYAGERERYTHAGNDYQVRHLGRLLGTSAPVIEPGQERIPVLLVRSGEQGIALHVDGLVGSREIVVKSVGPQLSTVRGLFGATILVDGRVALILDTNALALMGAQQQAAQAHEEVVEAVEEGPRETTVMIVDDSITVRRVTARLLERHDFRVITAKDGVDALQVLQDELPDIMLLDIEMPRMDGFELAQHVRGDPRLAEMPIIMITSRTGDKHRQRGMEIGVNRFLGKPYQDAELLDNIRELTEAQETAHG